MKWYESAKSNPEKTANFLVSDGKKVILSYYSFATDKWPVDFNVVYWAHLPNPPARKNDKEVNE